ncbi:Cathepsin_B [Hexamita inflata]|uniref:Cathepsin_B n=1 Tax=Hexamita inflata TaxID=28002 RepID=A0ABP1L5I6_9EUKA
MNAFSDYRCLQGNDSERIEYSPQYTLNCENNSGCGNKGINVLRNWQHLIDIGTVPSSCISYKSGVTGKTNKCPTKCDDGSQLPTLVKANDVVIICDSDYDNKEAIKQALANGPVSTQICVYEDLYYYEKKENGVKYWKVKNVWGREWGGNNNKTFKRLWRR